VEAVNWSKQKDLARSASVWIDRHGRPSDSYRFDVVGILVDGDRVRVRHVPNAFAVSRSA
jgi:putative endonuclease